MIAPANRLLPIRSLDTETERIGAGSVVPPFVCLTTGQRVEGQIQTDLWADGDPEHTDVLRDLLTVGTHILVGHNLPYDLAVIALTYPELEPLVWAKVAAGECTCTLIRQQLINLSTHGKLVDVFMPDGSSVRLNYGLDSIVMQLFGVDISAAKKSDDSWRLRFGELRGLKARQYPRPAALYALSDADWPIQVHEAQEAQCNDGTGASTETEFFQTAVAFALQLITAEGMHIDPDKFYEVKQGIEAELTDEKMAALVAAEIMRPSTPVRPFANQLKKAMTLVAEWTGKTDLSNDDYLALQPELEGCGIRFAERKDSSICQERQKARVLAAILAHRTDEPVDDLFARPLEELVVLAKERGITYKKTDGGDVCTDSEVIDEVALWDDTMKVFQARQELQKMVSTELPRMCWPPESGTPAEKVHFKFKVLVETGRTSSFAEELYPSANGQNVDPRARPCYVPGPGALFCSTDYSTLELCSVGHVMTDLFGFSIHAEKINEGKDLHAYLGAQLALKFDAGFRSYVAEFATDPDAVYLAFLELKKAGDKTTKEAPGHPLRDFYEHWRKFAKPIGLGFPGGLGPYKMIGLAKKTYDVDIIAAAVDRFETHPREFDLQNGTVLYWAKKLYGWSKDKVKWTPVLKGIMLARTMKDIWLNTYPEMKEFFKLLNGQRKKGGDAEDDRRDDNFSYVTPLGMVRNQCSYTAASNGQCMQSPSAEGFKWALFNLVRACRDESVGSVLFGRAQVVDEIHDEIITRFTDIELAHECAVEQQRIMEESMADVFTNVKIKAQPCLMERWYKEAEPVVDKATGRLVPWRPKPKAVTA